MFTIKAVVPPRAKVIGPAAFEKKIDEVLSRAENDIKIEFRKTVKTWVNKPAFYSKRTRKASMWMSDIGPHGKGGLLYSWVDLGTAEHDITPKNAPALVFMRGFQARTRPKVIGSGAMKRFPPLWRVQHVRQKIKPREFSDTIGTQYQPVFYNNLAKAFNTTAKSFEE